MLEDIIKAARIVKRVFTEDGAIEEIVATAAADAGFDGKAAKLAVGKVRAAVDAVATLPPADASSSSTSSPSPAAPSSSSTGGGTVVPLRQPQAAP